ncbi:hypothetical protein V8E55_010331 [Tylopilus felleus]
MAYQIIFGILENIWALPNTLDIFGPDAPGVYLITFGTFNNLWVVLINLVISQLGLVALWPSWGHI